MWLPTKVKSCENDSLFRARLIRSFQKIDSPTSDVQEKVLPQVHRLKWYFEAQRTKAVGIVIRAMLLHCQK